MPFDLSLPVYAVSAAFAVALLAVARHIGRNIRLRTYNKIHGGLRVIEVALILSPTARERALSRADRHVPAAAAQVATAQVAKAKAAEFVIYMTLKTGNL